MPADLKQTIKELMPRLTDELKTLVRLPSVAFPDFPAAPVEQTGAAVARLLTEAGLPNVRMVDVPRAPRTGRLSTAKITAAPSPSGRAIRGASI